MAKRFIVAKGRSLLHGERLIEEGSDVTGEGLKNMKHFIASGHVVEVGEEQSGVIPEAPAKFVEPLKADQTDGKRLETVGKWTLNPSKLEDKSIEQLNVLVKERDPSASPFEKREEAIARLSSDWKPSPAPVPAKR